MTAQSIAKRRESFACERCGRDTDGIRGTTRAGLYLCRECFGKGVDRRPRDLNDLDGKAWAAASRSVEQYVDRRSEKQRFHGAAFPMSLAKQQIEIFTKRGDVVLDPFLGVGTTLDACADLGRQGVGIELNEQFANLAKNDLLLNPKGGQQQVIVDDARRMAQYLEPSSVDFMLTSPPYGSLLKNVKGSFAFKWQEHSRLDAIRNPAPYSDHPRDLGNLDYEDFLSALTDCLRQSLSILKSRAYAVWVVKDFRTLKEGVPFVNFHSHFADRAQEAGFVLWDIRIYDQTKYRPLVCLGYPSRNFYLNIGHSYLVTLRTP